MKLCISNEVVLLPFKAFKYHTHLNTLHLWIKNHGVSVRKTKIAFILYCPLNQRWLRIKRANVVSMREERLHGVKDRTALHRPGSGLDT